MIDIKDQTLTRLGSGWYVPALRDEYIRSVIWVYLDEERMKLRLGDERTYLPLLLAGDAARFVTVLLTN